MVKDDALSIILSYSIWLELALYKICLEEIATEVLLKLKDYFLTVYVAVLSWNGFIQYRNLHKQITSFRLTLTRDVFLSSTELELFLQLREAVSHAFEQKGKTTNGTNVTSCLVTQVRWHQKFYFHVLRMYLSYRSDDEMK